MSSNVRKQMKTLEILKIAPPKIRQNILKNCDEKLVNAVSEICLNLCRGNIQCEKNSMKRLKKYRKKIRALSTIRKNKKDVIKRRNLLKQNGGSFLPILLSPLLGMLSDFIVNKT